MKLVKVLTILFVMVLYMSCVNNTKYKIFQESFNTIGINLASPKTVVVIPNEGCGGCISNATRYMIEHIDALNNSTCVIFTGIKDLKLFKLQVNNTFLNRSDVFIDANNELFKGEMSSIYPQIIYVEEGEVIDVVVFKEELLNIN